MMGAESAKALKVAASFTGRVSGVRRICAAQLLVTTRQDRRAFGHLGCAPHPRLATRGPSALVPSPL
jgi:hypothetical protein